MNLSKVWGFWLWMTQLLNGILAGIAYLLALPADAWPPLKVWQAKALIVHGGIVIVIGTLQAFAASLTDANKDGVPDIFQRPQ